MARFKKAPARLPEPADVEAFLEGAATRSLVRDPAVASRMARSVGEASVVPATRDDQTDAVPVAIHEQVTAKSPAAERAARRDEGARVRDQGAEATRKTSARVTTRSRRQKPVDGRNAKPTTGINLRLNDYQHALIRRYAEKEERSIQQVILRTLIPALEKALR